MSQCFFWFGPTDALVERKPTDCRTWANAQGPSHTSIAAQHPCPFQQHSVWGGPKDTVHLDFRLGLTKVKGNPDKLIGLGSLMRVSRSSVPFLLTAVWVCNHRRTRGTRFSQIQCFVFLSTVPSTPICKPSTSKLRGDGLAPSVGSNPWLGWLGHLTSHF